MKIIKLMAFLGVLFVSIFSSSMAKAQTKHPFMNYVINRLGGSVSQETMIGFLSGNSDFKYEVSEDNSSGRSVITVRYKDDDDWLFNLKGNNEGGATFTLYVYFNNKVLSGFDYIGVRESILSNTVIGPMKNFLTEMISQYYNGYEGEQYQSPYMKETYIHKWKDDRGSIFLHYQPRPTGKSAFKLTCYPSINP